ncbi:probable low affinity copper uptake protein 2 [Exaiptasia diaphana]|uniref:Copper transport protein n=1 Tax=Exaiptasia diaphana TaxID=2652724 RepID=A0A913XIS6_EXADI|nr:probable low affinity copper uptake protein 2 [Exaiptasia diaphana]
MKHNTVMDRLGINSTTTIKLDGFCTQCMSFFKVSNPNFVLLFEGWKISSITVLAGSCFGVFLLSILSEFVRFKRSKLQVRKNDHAPLPSETTNDVNETGNQSPDELSHSSVTLHRNNDVYKHQQAYSPFSTHHAIQVILHVTQLILGYVLMLIVMTFNVWLGISVVLGLGTGYFLCHNDYLVIPSGTQSNSSIELNIVK